MSTSSYENIGPTPLGEYKLILMEEIEEAQKEADLEAVMADEPIDVPSPPPAKYRRMPIAAVLDTYRDSVGECSFKTGHVLQLRGGRIICLNCPAEWKDEGF